MYTCQAYIIKAHNPQLCQLEYISDISFVIQHYFAIIIISQNAPQRNSKYLSKENSTFLPETKIFYKISLKPNFMEVKGKLWTPENAGYFENLTITNKCFLRKSIDSPSEIII